MAALPMLANNGLFQLNMEWRYWRSLWLKALFLIFSFALICALLTFVLQLGDRLFNAPPAWSNPSGHLYTVARQFEDGRLAPLHRKAIDIAAETPGVRAYSWFGIKNSNFQLAAAAEQELQVLYYSASFADVLGISALTATKTPGVWLSERYWREHLNSDPAVLDEYLQHKRFPAAVAVLGVLPAELNRIGPFQPDLWLHDDFKRHLAPFSPDSPIFLDRFLLAAPEHFGILSTAQPLNAKELTRYLHQQDLGVPGMKMGGDGSELVVFNGLNLDPPARLRLLQQWLLGLVLLAGFALVLGFNTLTMFTNRFIQQQQHYRIQRILGGNLAHFLLGPLIMCGLLIIAITVFSWLLIHGVDKLMMQQSSYLNLVGESGISLDWPRWLAALALVSILLLSCACLPVLRLTSGALFNREVGQSRSRGQKWLAQLNLGSQLLVALAAMVFLFTLSWQQWQQFRSYSLDTSLIVLPIQQQGGGIDVSALVQNNLAQINAEEVAFSLQAFDSQSTIELKDNRLAGPIAAQLKVVSGNYFQRLKSTLISGENNWQQGIVINNTLAQLLNSDSDKSILDSPLNLESLLGQHTIVGVVDNIPHQGLSQSVEPTIYLHHSSAPFYMNGAKNIELYFPAAERHRIEPALISWLQHQLGSTKMLQPSTLAAIITRHDQQSRQLLLFSTLMIALVLITVFFSLHYQVRSRILLEQQEYGVLLALGASDWHLLWRASRQAISVFTIIVPFTLALLALLLRQEGWLSSFGFGFSPFAFVLACSLLMVLTLLAAHQPVRQLLKTAIFNLLRTH